MIHFLTKEHESTCLYFLTSRLIEKWLLVVLGIQNLQLKEIFEAWTFRARQHCCHCVLSAAAMHQVSTCNPHLENIKTTACPLHKHL